MLKPNGNGMIREGRFFVDVPASTSNLGPGLDCLGLALNLHLRFEAEVGTPDNGVERPIDTFGEKIDPVDDFLVHGFRRALQMWGLEPPLVRFKVLEQPPIARGLGSSAAALVGGAALAEALVFTPVGRREVARVAFSIEGRTDNVCASALGGLVITSATSDGRVLVRDIKIDPMWKVAVAVPELRELGEEARNVLPETVPLDEAVTNLGRSMLLIHALVLGDVSPFPEFTEDLLHQPFRCPLIPGYDTVKARAMEAGAAGVFLSGSGSSVAAFVSGDAKEVADAMAEGFAEAGVKAVGLALSVNQQGYRVTRL